MNLKIAIISGILIACNGLSIEKVSERRNKRSVISVDVFTDGTSSENDGNEFGNPVPTPKKKVKKRLASPMNYNLVAVEPEENDEYYEKGGSDNDDNYESKDWSDLNRLVEPSSGNKTLLKHVHLTEVDGIGVLKNGNENHASTDVLKRNNENHNDQKIKPEETPNENDNEDQKHTIAIHTTEKIQAKRKRPRYEDYNDYDDSGTDKKVIIDEDKEKDDRENEAKKAKILDAVDDLKARHLQESKIISEKFKEEEFERNEFERNSFKRANINDEYDDSPYHKRGNKLVDYDEYDDRRNMKEKYYPGRKLIKTSKTTSTTQKPEGKPKKYNQKVSVFKSPQLYLTYDDENEESSEHSGKTTTGTTKLNPDEARISLVPEDAKEGEPTLFFPKRTKKKKLHKNYHNNNKSTESSYTDNEILSTAKILPNEITGTPNEVVELEEHTQRTLNPGVVRVPAAFTLPDYTTAENIKYDSTRFDMDQSGSYQSNIIANENDIDIETNMKYKGTTDSNFEGSEETAGTETSGPDYIEETNTQESQNIVRDDLVPESSDHQHKDTHKKKGGGHGHKSQYEEENEEHGKKSYEQHEEAEVTGKGYHDVTKDVNKYDNHGHENQKYGDESDHDAAHDHKEAGKKYAEYEEVGKHSKGHSTKGSHDVHKKEEYEKNVEFFDDSTEADDDVKTRKVHKSFEHSSRYRPAVRTLVRSNDKRRDVERARPKNNKQARGEEGKKWIFHQGFPARNSNLVLIDRRDPVYRPNYYG